MVLWTVLYALSMLTRYHPAVTITDQHTDPTDHHVALVLAQAVPGVVHAKVEHSTTQQT
jgi:hypothetical protein